MCVLHFLLHIVVLLCVLLVCLFFFFKQKTAYEMRISDWSSDVCSSDLPIHSSSRLAQILRTRPAIASTGPRQPGRAKSAGSRPVPATSAATLRPCRSAPLVHTSK